jgi:hypothetical protein
MLLFLMWLSRSPTRLVKLGARATAIKLVVDHRTIRSVAGEDDVRLLRANPKKV